MATAERSRSRRDSQAIAASQQQPAKHSERRKPLVTRRRLGLALLGWPALVPLVFMTPCILLYNTSTLHQSGNDVFGSGSAALFLAMLAVTPAVLLTGARWFSPGLRQWFGVMFAVGVITDGITAATDSSFAGGVAGRLAGHSFLLIGFIMVLISIPLLATANNRAQRELGKYWRPFQRYGTYAVWGLLIAHLAVLEGLGVSHGGQLGPDRFPFNALHQRLYQVLLVSAPLLALRLPPVKRWVTACRKRGNMTRVWLAVAPLLIIGAIGYAYLWNELVFKGTGAFTLNPVND